MAAELRLGECFGYKCGGVAENLGGGGGGGHGGGQLLPLMVACSYVMKMFLEALVWALVVLNGNTSFLILVAGIALGRPFLSRYKLKWEGHIGHLKQYFQRLRNAAANVTHLSKLCAQSQ